MADKLWKGRFGEKTDRSVEKFTASIDVDKRLYACDIDGSIAHCTMLAKVGVISDDEAGELIDGLRKIKREIERDEFEFDAGLEDIHMHIESRLFQQVGKVAQKLHTARSRNDQVALDVRMFLRDETAGVIRSLENLQRVLVEIAEANIDVVLPGYTHLQRAQPVLWSHHLMAYYEMFARDGERFSDCIKRINVMPLGSAALAGTTYPIDREHTAGLLGFPKIGANSIDCVSDRDFIIEFLAAASICMMHFSRFAEELILWSSTEFSFIELPDAFATGSSIMPQKKNPDVPELVRGKTGRVYGDLMALLTLMKGLPLSYNRDMQEDKEPLFNSLDILKSSIDIFTRLLPRLKINESVMRQAASRGFLNATDMADYLVAKGVTFREAHEVVGKAVSHALSKNKELHELSLKELKKFSALVEKDLFEFLDVDDMIRRRISPGGTAKANVKAEIAAAQKRPSTGNGKK